MVHRSNVAALNLPTSRTWVVASEIGWRVDISTHPYCSQPQQRYTSGQSRVHKAGSACFNCRQQGGVWSALKSVHIEEADITETRKKINHKDYQFLNLQKNWILLDLMATHVHRFGFTVLHDGVKSEGDRPTVKSDAFIRSDATKVWIC